MQINTNGQDLDRCASGNWAKDGGIGQSSDIKYFSEKGASSPQT
jgi:hypothetical protein